VALQRARALDGDGPSAAPGLYTIQAEIAALHSAPERDWREISERYAELLALTDSPVVALNRAVALAEAEGPETGLSALEGLELDGYHYLHATRAELLRRVGRGEEARRCYRRALELVRSEAERRFLERRLAEL
jgi:RNA polymerase sigma-70 factor (ECF subfamily)